MGKLSDPPAPGVPGGGVAPGPVVAPGVTEGPVVAGGAVRGDGAAPVGDGPPGCGGGGGGGQKAVTGARSRPFQGLASRALRVQPRTHHVLAEGGRRGNDERRVEATPRVGPEARESGGGPIERQLPPAAHGEPAAGDRDRITP